MSTAQTIQPLAPNPHIAPVDPNVVIPDHVKAAAAAADAAHAALYATKEPEALAPDPAAEEAARAAAAQAAAEATAAAPAAPEPAPQEQHPAPTAADQNVSAEEWRHRFLSMQGRYNASLREKASMEEQMTQLGQELVRTQNMLAQTHTSPQPQAPNRTDHGNVNLITPEDVEGYGEEMIDLARRAALSAVGPELQQLRQENEQLKRRTDNVGKQELFARLTAALPNWRQINTSAQFKTWLRLPNVYTGQLRQNMLKAAVDGAEAPKVIALFRDFLAEANATGAGAPAEQIEQPAPAPAPRQPAVSLDTLAAPGRARPASGDSQVPSEKPIYTRAQITKFYDEKRRGFFAGREAEVAAFETDLGLAQREGRIR